MSENPRVCDKPSAEIDAAGETNIVTLLSGSPRQDGVRRVSMRVGGPTHARGPLKAHYDDKANKTVDARRSVYRLFLILAVSLAIIV
jgi:hypothetical protein